MSSTHIHPEPSAATQSAYPSLPPPVPVNLATFSERTCPYLPDRTATFRALYAGRIHERVYHNFLDAGFRRAGHVIYQPVCRGCRACQPLRVPVADFRPDKSQRRCARRNQDLLIQSAPPALTDEKHDLYRRYLTGRHNGTMDDSGDSLEDFLYDSPVRTLEFTYRDSTGKLLAVGICDVCEHSIGSVYFYFDPAESKRGLGNFGVLMEIDYARRMNIPHWYAGFWIKGCRAMEYKNSFRPCELLHPDGVWRKWE